MHYRDYTEYEYGGYAFPNVKRIGWLENGHPFNKGIVDSHSLKILEHLLFVDSRFNAKVNMLRGLRPCSICGSQEEVERGLSSGELWIPYGADHFFSAPTLILHYIRKHKYCPPTEFLKALGDIDLDSDFHAESVQARFMQSIAPANEKIDLGGIEDILG